MNLYVSTSCLKEEDDLFEILDIYHKNELKNVELGPRTKYLDNLDNIKKYNFNFLVHNYFPPPQEPFVVNLASQNEKILAQSKEQIKKSIRYCCNLGIKLFTFHTGFRADPDNNFCFPKRVHITSYKKAFATFVESIKEINDYAVKREVNIAVENNVLSEYNLVKGNNELFLLCEAIEFELLWEEIRSSNLGILLDLGHLKITSHWLNFDRYEFIEKVKEKTFAIHIHDNDGISDTHSQVVRSSWCLEIIRKDIFKQIPIVLESTGLTLEKITQQLRLIENAGNNDGD